MNLTIRQTNSHLFAAYSIRDSVVRYINWRERLLVLCAVVAVVGFLISLKINADAEAKLEVAASFQEPSFAEPAFQKRVLTHIVNHGVTETQAQRIIASVFKHSLNANVDPLLTLAIIEVESSYRCVSISTAGAIGCMQVLPSAHPEKFKSLTQLFDIDFNIYTGVRIYREYLQRLGNQRLALKQYNGSLHLNTKYAEEVIDARTRLTKLF